MLLVLIMAGGQALGIGLDTVAGADGVAGLGVVAVPRFSYLETVIRNGFQGIVGEGSSTHDGKEMDCIPEARGSAGVAKVCYALHTARRLAKDLGATVFDRDYARWSGSWIASQPTYTGSEGG